MLLAAADNDIRLHTLFLKLFDGMLCRLCLKLLCCREIRHQGKMHVDAVVAEFPFQLADSLYKRK